MERAQTPVLALFGHIADVIPLFWTLVAVAVAIGVGEVVLLAIAVRRQSAAGQEPATGPRPPAGLAIAAAAGPVLLAGLIAVSVHRGHQMLLDGIATVMPRENVPIIIAGLEAFANAKAFGPLLLGPVLGLGVLAASVSAAATLNVRPRLLVTASILFVGGGLGPFLYGAHSYSTETIKVLAGVAGVDVAMKELMITKGLEETRELLDRWAVVGTVGFVVALVVTIVMVVRAGVPPQGRGIRWWSPVLCLVAAAGLFLAAEPLRAENTTPWPEQPPMMGAALTNNVVSTPDNDGPDKVPRTVVVTVTNDLMLADGTARTETELRDALTVMRNNYRLLHPGEQDDENLVIVCGLDTRTKRLTEVLRWADGTQYRRLAFAFGKQTTIERPLLGTLPRWTWTATKALLPGVGPEQPTPIVTLDVAVHPTCDEVARAATAIRHDGKIAGLKLEPEWF